MHYQTVKSRMGTLLCILFSEDVVELFKKKTWVKILSNEQCATGPDSSRKEVKHWHKSGVNGIGST